MFQTLRESFHSITSINMYMVQCFLICCCEEMLHDENIFTLRRVFSVQYNGSSCPHNLQYCMYLHVIFLLNCSHSQIIFALNALVVCTLKLSGFVQEGGTYNQCLYMLVVS